MKWWLVGLLIMIVSEAATLARIEPFWSWNTPIAWTGFIIFADDIVWGACGNSWIRSNPREFAFLALVSIPLWLVFEGYNQFIDNWYYVGLPENRALRLFGYAWSFATIWPAIFEGAELIAVWRGSRSNRLRRGYGGPPGGPPKLHAEAEDLRDITRSGYIAPAASIAPVAQDFSPAGWAPIATGATMLIVPFIVPRDVARYMAAPVWLGFIFLLDPIDARLGGESLAGDLRAGRHERLINLALSGLLCSVLWEFWNYWSRAKWHYTVPIMERAKIFEMPLPGYLGFPAFALECFTMYVFVRLICGIRQGRTIAL